VTVRPQPMYLQSDEARLIQVISNLLTNAAKYTEPGGRIRLRGERHGGGATVSVRDNGIGIAADTLPRVFDMFMQVEGKADRRKGGLGIGLALGRRLVTLLGGGIEARSDGPGKGSEFIVYLPLHAEATADGEVAKPQAEKQALHAESLRWPR